MNRIEQHDTIPLQGKEADEILRAIDRLQDEDVHWKEGRAWSLVYFAGEEHDALLKEAAARAFSANYLNPFAFRSLQHMEQEVVRMTISMLNGNGEAVGVMTSGGTESILLTMLTYRQMAQKQRPAIKKPEVIVPATIHPAFDKAAILFGIQLRKAPVGEDLKAVPAVMEKLVNANTILLVASAPSYPNGVMDPIEAIAAIAVKHQLPLHVDACIGGFMLPWLEKLGMPTPAWDFRIHGVTSISADVHKFGYGAKGASVIAYKSMDYLRHQFVLTTDFPGGIYVSPTLMGTRPGAPIAAAWAAMLHLGQQGYLDLARRVLDATLLLRKEISAIPGINILGDPCMNILSFGTINNDPDIFVVADQLEGMGWLVDRQQFPVCIHLTVLPTNIPAVPQYIADLKRAIQFARQNPSATAKGNAAIYGLMARVPFRGMVSRNVLKIMENMYSGVRQKDMEQSSATVQHAIINKQPLWMGWVNRLLLFLKRFKRS